MGGCAFEDCQHCNEPWAILHRFPADSVVRKKWLKAIDRKGFRANKSSRVCRAHFTYESYVFGTNRLRHGAVPQSSEASRKIVPQPSFNGTKRECLTKVNDNQIDDDEKPTGSGGIDDSSNLIEETVHKRVRLYTQSISSISNSENEPPANTFQNSPITKSSIMPADFANLIAKAYPRSKRQQAHSTKNGSEVRLMPLPTNEDVLRRKLNMYRLKLWRRNETIERLKMQIADCNQMLLDAKKTC